MGEAPSCKHLVSHQQLWPVCVRFLRPRSWRGLLGWLSWNCRRGGGEKAILGNLDSHVKREEFHLAKPRNYSPLPDKDPNAAISDSLHSVCVFRTHYGWGQTATHFTDNSPGCFRRSAISGFWFFFLITEFDLPSHSWDLLECASLPPQKRWNSEREKRKFSWFR